MAKSILQDRKECFITKSTDNLHCHHVFSGAYRKNSEKFGLKVWLRADWHNASDFGVHFDKNLDLFFRQLAQRKFEETHTRDEFIRYFTKSYL